MTIDNLLETFADMVAERLAARIGAGAASKVVYSTSKRGPCAPGKSRMWLMRHIKTMPGARKVGRDYVIDAADFDRWAAALDASTLRKPKPVVGDAEALADAYLADAGYRKSKRVA